MGMQNAVLRSQGFSPLGRFYMQGERRFRDAFNLEKANGKIYPNAGRSSRKIGACAKQSECKR